jgi:hypothetical protein
MINKCKLNEERISNKIRIFKDQLKRLNDSLNSINEIKYGVEEYLNGVNMPSNIVNKIVEKIIVYEDDNYNNLFPVKNDKAIIMNVEIAGGKDFDFLLSRYSQEIYILIDLNNPTGFEIPKIENFTGINKYVATSGIEGTYPKIPDDFKFDFFEI